MTICTNIVKIKFIVPVHFVAAKPLKINKFGAVVRIGQYKINGVSKKWKIKYLTMNEICDIIITERGR